MRSTYSFGHDKTIPLVTKASDQHTNACASACVCACVCVRMCVSVGEDMGGWSASQLFDVLAFLAFWHSGILDCECVCVCVSECCLLVMPMRLVWAHEVSTWVSQYVVIPSAAFSMQVHSLDVIHCYNLKHQKAHTWLTRICATKHIRIQFASRWHNFKSY